MHISIAYFFYSRESLQYAFSFTLYYQLMNSYVATLELSIQNLIDCDYVCTHFKIRDLIWDGEIKVEFKTNYNLIS